MKKVLLVSIVAGIIGFIWQSLSWTVLPVHKNSIKYTPKQDSILSYLSGQSLEDGRYYIPNLENENSATMAEQEKYEKSRIGKPFIMIDYHPSYPGMGAGLFIRGILYNFISCFLVALIISNLNLSSLNFSKIMMLVMTVPLIVILQATLTDANWWSTPFHFYIGTIIDLIISWLLISVWMGYMFSKK